MIFYNQTIRLGAKADKRNLLDIFLHQDHGIPILIGIFFYATICVWGIWAILQLPSIPYPFISSSVLYYGLNTIIVLTLVVGFYFFRYGGTLWHDNKPEWDTIPAVVKKIFSLLVQPLMICRL